MIGVFAIWQPAKPATLRCFDQDKRPSSLAHYTDSSKTIASTSISYYKKLPSRRTFPVTSQSGKTANKQVPSWSKMLVDTWLDWSNKLPPQKSWDASGSWNKKMQILGQVKRILLCTSQYTLKIPNQPNHLWMREELPLQYVVNGICPHLYIPRCHTVHPRP